MKQLHILSLVIIFSVLLQSCNNPVSENKTVSDIAVDTIQINEFEILITYLEENNNYINSDAFPSLISSKEVLENIGNKKYLILDIREKEAFSLEYIEGSENVLMRDLISYFENKIDYLDYDKIILVCFSGQKASYATGVLRLLGYNNTYALEFGLGYWNPTIAQSVWVKNLSSDYQKVLENKANKKSKNGEYPIISTNFDKPKEILRARAEQLLSDGYKDKLVNMTELYLNGSGYYIINYWDKERYNAGHLIGAIQYTPKKSLSKGTYLYTLPTNETIVVYGSTGLDEAFVVAYLNILGYNSKALIYGANGFMHKNLEKLGWDAYSISKINDYPLIGYLNN